MSQMSMDSVRPLSPAEDDSNAWTIRNCFFSFWNVMKNPFRHTYGIRNAARPTKSPLDDTREAVATTAKMHTSLGDPYSKSNTTISSSEAYRLTREGDARTSL